MQKNWQQLIQEIMARGGLTQKKIAEQCDSRPTTISSLLLKAGSEPGHALGCGLVKLHTRITRTWERKNNRRKP